MLGREALKLKGLRDLLRSASGASAIMSLLQTSESFSRGDVRSAPPPAVAPPAAPLCTRAFRDALAAFGTGVTVVTTRGEDGVLHGATISSFASVSLDPPLVLWSQARTAGSLPVFLRASHFAVNVLAHDQAALAERFAQRRLDKFDGLDLDFGVGGSPLLKGAAARFQCSAYSQHDGGDHVIFLGRVEHCFHRRMATLMVRHGQYLTALDA